MAYKYPEYPSMEYVDSLSDAQKEELVAEMDKRRAHAMEMHEKDIEAQLQASESVGKNYTQAEVDRIAKMSDEELQAAWDAQESREAQAQDGVKKSVGGVTEEDIAWLRKAQGREEVSKQASKRVWFVK